ncbi:MAG: hypothetical protein ACLGI6_24000, partial [Gammaproteobacteria bacterium]
MASTVSTAPASSCGTTATSAIADLDAALAALPTLSATDEPATSRELLAVLRAAEDELSEREREVLRLLATELSGPEIARRLF